MRDFEARGYWVATTSNEELERAAKTWPDKLAVADPRIRLTYKDYFTRAQRLAATPHTNVYRESETELFRKKPVPAAHAEQFSMEKRKSKWKQKRASRRTGQFCTRIQF